MKVSEYHMHTFELSQWSPGNCQLACRRSALRSVHAHTPVICLVLFGTHFTRSSPYSNSGQGNC